MNKLTACLIILFFFSLAFFSIQSIEKLEFGYKLENFFSDKNSDFEFYKSYKTNFGNDNNFLMVAYERKEGVFDIDFLKKIDTVSAQLKKIEAVEYLFSPTSIKRKVKVPLFGVLDKPLVDLSSQEFLNVDKKNIYESPGIYSSLFSKDTSSLILYLVVSENLTKSERKQLLTTVKTITNQNSDNGKVNIHYAGQINTQSYYISALEGEVILFSALTLLLLILFLYLTYKSFFVVTSTIIILVLSVLLSLALINFSLGELDFLMTMLPTLLFVIGISNTIHFLATFKELYLINQDKRETIKLTIKTAGTSTFLSSLTTSVGFLALYFLPIKPVQYFGLFSAAGIMITWLTNILLLPSFLYLVNRYNFVQRKGLNWNGFLGRMINQILIRKRIIGYATIVILFMGVIGVFRIHTNSNFLDDLNDRSTLKADLSFFEKKYNGIRPFELSVMTKNDSNNFLDLDYLQKIEEISSYLGSNYQVGMLQSVNTIIKEINIFLHAGNTAYNRIPNDESELNDIRKVLTKYHLTERLNFLVDSAFTTSRFTGKMEDLGSAKLNKKNIELHNFLANYNDSFDFKLTGAAHLMDQTNNNVSLHLIQGLLFSLILVTLLIAIALKSIRIALLSLIPNFIPLFLIAGVMGWLNIDLKIASALIFTIIFGIAVDDTIHFLMRYRLEYKKNKTVALTNTYKQSGKKLILTSFILCSGFLAFTLSEFNSTFYAGFLVTAGLIIALLSDLVYLPLLLKLTEKK